MIDYTLIDEGLKTGSKSAFSKDDLPGKTVTGTITDLDYRQTTDYTTGKPAEFEDGSPKMQFVITIQTGEQVDADDDGQRAVYIPAWGNKKRALLDAMRAFGSTKASEAFALGNTFTATFLEEKKQFGRDGRSSYHEKMFSYQIAKGDVAGMDKALQEQAAPTQAAPPAPTPAPAASAGQAASQGEQITTLIQAGLDDQAIASALQIDPSMVAIIRNTIK